MNAYAFVLSLFTLLVVPGPTNALLLAMGAAGPRRALAAPVAALAGNLLAIGIIGALIGPVITQYPVVSLGLRLVAGAYLLLSAFKLWRAQGLAGEAVAPPLSAVFLTTLLNPKAIIIALVLMPMGWGQDLRIALPALVIVAGEILIVSTLWLGLGVALRASLAKLGGERTTSRVSALVLALFGVSLMVASLAR